MSFNIKKIVSMALCVCLGATSVPTHISAYEGTYEYGVDISKYQGNINWNDFKESGMNFVIMRAGTSWYGIDAKFEEYYEGASSIGVKKGAYLYMASGSLEEFKKDANTFLEYLDGKQWEMPVYIDLEENFQTEMGKKALTTYALLALNIISDAGYTAGLYANKNWFTNYIDRDLVEKAGYEIWWAQYLSMDTPVNPLNYDKSDVCGIWQYSSRGIVKGIPDNVVDLNIAYKIYPLKNSGRKCDELWMSDSETVQAIKCGPGRDYERLFYVPSDLLLNVTERRYSDGTMWGKVNIGGYVGWCSLDKAVRINFDNDPDVINPVLYDVNNDGQIDANDEFELRKYILALQDQGIEADTNGDGSVNVFDCQRIKKLIIDEISERK